MVIEKESCIKVSNTNLKFLFETETYGSPVILVPLVIISLSIGLLHGTGAIRCIQFC